MLFDLLLQTSDLIMWRKQPAENDKKAEMIVFWTGILFLILWFVALFRERFSMHQMMDMLRQRRQALEQSGFMDSSSEDSSVDSQIFSDDWASVEDTSSESQYLIPTYKTYYLVSPFLYNNYILTKFGENIVFYIE